MNKLIEGGSQAEASDIAPIGPPVVSDESSGAFGRRNEKLLRILLCRFFMLKSFGWLLLIAFAEMLTGCPKAAYKWGFRGRKS